MGTLVGYRGKTASASPTSSIAPSGIIDTFRGSVRDFFRGPFHWDRFDRTDPFRPFAVTPAGPYQGQPVDTDHYRSAQILTPKEVKVWGLEGDGTFVANVVHGGKFWIAHIPDNPVEDVIFQRPWFERFPSSHVQARFVMKPDKKVTLYPQDGIGRPLHLSDLVCSSDGVPPLGKPYSLSEGLFGHYLMAHSVESLHKQYEDYVERQGRVVEQIPTSMPDAAKQIFFRFFLEKATTSGLSEIYRTSTYNCSTVMLDLLARALMAVKHVEVPEHELGRSIPNELRLFLRSWNVLDKDRELADLQAEFPSHPDAPPGLGQVQSSAQILPFRRRALPTIPRPAVIANRGASGFAPESTRIAYEVARDLGVDYLEGDIQRTKDGVLVVVHDEDLRRTSNVAEVFPGREFEPVHAFTYDELRQLDFGSWFSRDFVGEKVLTLEELLKIAEAGPRSIGVYLDIPNAADTPGMEKEIVDLLTERRWLDRGGAPLRSVVFQSFDADSLSELHRLAPDVPMTYLYGRSTSIGKALNEAKRVGACALGPGAAGARMGTIQTAHEAGLLVHPYTIDDPPAMKRMFRSGADGLFTRQAHKTLMMLGRLDEQKLGEVLARHLGPPRAEAA